MVSLSDATAVYYGDKPVQAIYYGQTKVWPTRIRHWVFDFEKPGIWKITAPAGAKYFHQILSAGGNSGQRGDGALGKPGLGGMGGGLQNSLNLEVPDGGSGYVTIGKGGVEPNYKGEDSRIDWGVHTKVAKASDTLFSSTINGEYGFYYPSGFNARFASIPGTVDGVKVVHDSEGNLYVGTPGLYKGGAGTPGARGGGGSGGEGGTFGRFSPGGAGGDGFCRIVFTDRKIA